MKRLLIAVLLLLSVNVAFSQKYDRKIAASDKNIADPKKGISPKTWISRGELFYDIAIAPIESLERGMTEETYKLILAGLGADEPIVQEETVGTKAYIVHSYDNRKLYYDNSIVQFWDILKYETPNPWQKSYEAFMKAKSLDTEGKSAKKLKEWFKQVSKYVREEAFNKYYLGQSDEALELFTLSINSADEAGVVDSTSLYAAGVIAITVKQYDVAEKYLRRAIEIGYVENGETYALLAEALKELGKNDESREILEKSIVNHPNNQQLLLSLINSYLNANIDPKNIIPLIKKAQATEPNNINLYIVEGELSERIDDMENADKCYKKAIEIAPDNFAGYFKKGFLFYNKGVKYSEQAINEKNTAESNRLLELADGELKKALPFFDKAFELNPDEIATIQALKEINFRFRMDSDTYKQNAEKYSKLLEERK
jgi:tetratricopeptide (TPR) repeat protein